MFLPSFARKCAQTCVSFALFAHGNLTLAQELPRARLEFTVTPAAERCASEGQLRQLVAARLGRDPFDPTAAVTIRVRVERGPGGVRATVHRIEAQRASAARALFSRRADCADLAPALGLSVSMAIDPLARAPGADATAPADLRAPRAPESTPLPSSHAEVAPPPPRPTERVSSPQTSTPPTASTVRGVVFATLGASVQVGALPNVALGPNIAVGVRYGSLVAALEGRLQLSWPTDFGAFVVHSTLSYIALRLCGRLPIDRDNGVDMELCARSTLGSLASHATPIDRSTPVSSLYAATGMEIAAVVHFNRRLGGRVGMSAEATLSRTRQTIDEGGRERELWLAPPVSVSATIEGVLYFP